MTMVLSILYFLYGKSWMCVLLLDPKDKRITWHFFFHENLGTANLISEWPRSIRSFSLTHVNVDTTALLSAHRDHHKFFAYRIAKPLQHFHIYFSAEVLGTANISPMHRDTTSHGITRGCRLSLTQHSTFFKTPGAVLATLPWYVSSHLQITGSLSSFTYHCHTTAAYNTCSPMKGWCHHASFFPISLPTCNEDLLAFELVIKSGGTRINPIKFILSRGQLATRPRALCIYPRPGSSLWVGSFLYSPREWHSRQITKFRISRCRWVVKLTSNQRTKNWTWSFTPSGFRKR